MTVSETLGALARDARETVIGALASVVLRERTKTLIADLEAQRGAALVQADAFTIQARDAETQLAHATERYNAARAALTTLPAATDWGRADHERHDALLGAVRDTKRDYDALVHRPRTLRQHAQHCQTEADDLAAKIAALKTFDVSETDAAILRTLGIE